jgi:hypothetical protein
MQADAVHPFRHQAIVLVADGQELLLRDHAAVMVGQFDCRAERLFFDYELERAQRYQANRSPGLTPGSTAVHNGR